jgi:hypothetical protein
MINTVIVITALALISPTPRIHYTPHYPYWCFLKIDPSYSKTPGSGTGVILIPAKDPHRYGWVGHR